MRAGVMVLALLIPIGLGAQAPMKSVDELRAFFAENCVKCHGPDGSAHSAEGKKLGGFDFTDAKKVAKETDADMIKTIRKGIFFGLVMPSFKAKLTEDDAALLVKDVLRKAEKGKAIAPKAGTGR
ncbi:MAG TPA: c-type cytochrome [Geothrix sp.]|nr:c-type cytochrome [Geothrix sp.]